MARLKFSADYNHPWPSGAETAYKNNGEYTVKREVADAAVPKYAQELPAAGATKDVRGRKVDDAEPEKTLANNLPADLAEPPALDPSLRDKPETE